ncbi:dienelactone hydrolase family protein [Derxia gummosa]|uniref:Dienelactone hydrolase family protein n=1 Tax=Derxia gummosa DSM 723 TaxID=1121388 RepID=A0A8B6X169_9BURK|nr:dienelactone hydrolase family protein [Derxia gummosa]
MPHADDSCALAPTAPASPDRRDFMRGAVGVGFAAAVLPTLAQTAIHTPPDGLVAGELRVNAGADTIPAYRARPAAGAGWPVVLVVSEIFGVHEHIADLCRRLARAGYYAIAPELFVRQGDAKAEQAIPDLIRNVVAKKSDAETLADLDATVATAAADGGDTGRLAITGFCWGGRVVWMYAAHSKRLKAGVAWYGKLVAGFNPALQPRNPVDVAARLNAPVLGLYGGKDDSIPLDGIERMKAELAKGTPASRGSSFVVYPQAGHAFNADYRPSYVADAAQDGWKRMLDWFKANGV